MLPCCCASLLLAAVVAVATADTLAGMLMHNAADELCTSQESHLAVLWTVGIFALNCGPGVLWLLLEI